MDESKLNTVADLRSGKVQTSRLGQERQMPLVLSRPTILVLHLIQKDSSDLFGNDLPQFLVCV